MNFVKYVIRHANQLHPTESFQHSVLVPSSPNCWLSPSARTPRDWNSAMHCFFHAVTWIRMLSVPFGGLVEYFLSTPRVLQSSTEVFACFLVLMIKIKLLQTPAHGSLGEKIFQAICINIKGYNYWSIWSELNFVINCQIVFFQRGCFILSFQSLQRSCCFTFSAVSIWAKVWMWAIVIQKYIVYQCIIN